MPDPTWHVLLFGAATEGLRGVAADLLRMQALVARMQLHGVALTTWPAATRADFIAGFTDLCARVRPGDGVLVYYSGHGLRLRDPDTRELAYALAPVGAAEAPPGEFGYLLQEELSAWFWRITAVTRNVTWIADCCHAGGVFRGQRVARGLAERLQSFLALRRGLLAELPPAALDPDGNPHVVRVCASASDRKAFEDPGDGGLFTRALVDVLAELSDRPIVCEDLARLLVRKLVRDRQLPTIAGPVRRWWLTAHEAPPRSFPTTVLHARGTLLAGGALLDHRPGDRYVVHDVDGNAAVELEIIKVLAHRSHTVRVPADDVRPLSVGATAVLRHAAVPRGAVEVDAPAALTRALTASGYVTTTATPSAPTIARIVVRDERVHLLLPTGDEVGTWPIDTPDPLCAAVDGLTRQSALLRLLASDPALLASKYRCTIQAGAVVIDNLSIVPIYVSAFELHPSGAIELVTRGQPDGEAVTTHHSHTVRPLQNSARTGPRRLVLVVTDNRIDLRAWTCEPPTTPDTTRGDHGPWFGVHAFTL